MKELNKLQINRRRGVVNFLHSVSDFDYQLDYKNKVPFVHIPMELLAQWDGLYTYTRDKKWFKDAFSHYELELLDNFNKTIQEIKEGLGPNYPDVPDIFESKHWKRLADEASKMINVWDSLNQPFRSKDLGSLY